MVVFARIVYCCYYIHVYFIILYVVVSKMFFTVIRLINKAYVLILCGMPSLWRRDGSGGKSRRLAVGGLPV